MSNTQLLINQLQIQTLTTMTQPVDWPRDLLLRAINDTVEAHSCVDNSEIH